MKSASAHIESKAGVCGGRPCVVGTRIRVQDIFVWHELRQWSADEIVSQFPQLTLADVYAALTYYWDNREEIERHLNEDRSLVESLKREQPSLLAEKLKRADAANDPLSS